MKEPSRVMFPGEFPSGLHEIPQPPARLYVRGTMPPPETKMLVVVGSRALSSYGREACERLIEGLAGYPVCIVSGLALGADACAQKAALAAGLHTVAVLGSGIDDASLHPRTNLGLARDILAHGGALLSENPDGYRPHVYDFPKRNRIVVGLSQAVLIVEAAERSGTLITARLAGEYNRDLLYIPHRIGDPHGFAAHLFGRIGAMPVSESTHILEALGLEPHRSERKPITLQGDEKVLYDLLATPMQRDELMRASGLAASDALTILVTLELRGILKEEFGLWRRA